MLRAAAERRSAEPSSGRRYLLATYDVSDGARDAVAASSRARSCGARRRGSGHCRDGRWPRRSAALYAAQCSRPGAAAAMPTKLTPKTSEQAAPTATVMVTNARKADLVQLQAARAARSSWKKVLGPLKVRRSRAGYNCRGRSTAASTCTEPSADGQSMDASDVDVCTQKTLNLTD